VLFVLILLLSCRVPLLFFLIHLFPFPFALIYFVFSSISSCCVNGSSFPLLNVAPGVRTNSTGAPSISSSRFTSCFFNASASACMKKVFSWSKSFRNFLKTFFLNYKMDCPSFKNFLKEGVCFCHPGHLPCGTL